MQGKILIIEDETELGELIQLYLEKEGLGSALCATGEEGLRRFRSSGADLVVLDINLPGIDGFEVLHALRKESPVPVIIVSARESDEDIIAGLGIGADEFVVKPFAPKVLVARIRAVLRRSRMTGIRPLFFGPYRMEPEGYSLTRDGRKIPLSAREFEVLRFLTAHPGQALPPEAIYRGVWGQTFGDLTSVAVYIRRIRHKIEEDGNAPLYVQTIRGQGYRFNRETLRENGPWD